MTQVIENLEKLEKLAENISDLNGRIRENTVGDFKREMFDFLRSWISSELELSVEELARIEVLLKVSVDEIYKEPQYIPQRWDPNGYENGIGGGCMIPEQHIPASWEPISLRSVLERKEVELTTQFVAKKLQLAFEIYKETYTNPKWYEKNNNGNATQKLNLAHVFALCHISKEEVTPETRNSNINGLVNKQLDNLPDQQSLHFLENLLRVTIVEQKKDGTPYIPVLKCLTKNTLQTLYKASQIPFSLKINCALVLENDGILAQIYASTFGKQNYQDHSKVKNIIFSRVSQGYFNKVIYGKETSNADAKLEAMLIADSINPTFINAAIKQFDYAFAAQLVVAWHDKSPTQIINIIASLSQGQKKHFLSELSNTNWIRIHGKVTDEMKKWSQALMNNTILSIAEKQQLLAMVVAITCHNKQFDSMGGLGHFNSNSQGGGLFCKPPGLIEKMRKVALGDITEEHSAKNYLEKIDKLLPKPTTSFIPQHKEALAYYGSVQETISSVIMSGNTFEMKEMIS